MIEILGYSNKEAIPSMYTELSMYTDSSFNT
jgi:hypothetical protein